jgi:hypothetical protein
MPSDIDRDEPLVCQKIIEAVKQRVDVREHHPIRRAGRYLQ